MEAREPGRAREEVLAIVSHDLRNPLSAILMSAANLLRLDAGDERAPQIRSKAETTQHSAARMARMIEHLFDFEWTGGLTIAKGVSDAHGGRIWVEGQVGVGSRFAFTLPLASAREQQLEA